MSAAESQQQALQQEKDNAADRVQALQQDLDAANAKAAEFESAIADTRAALEQAGSQAAAITAQREETRRQTEQLNLDLVTLAKDSAAAKMSIEDLLARKNSAADRVAATRREIDQIRAAQTGFAAQTEQLQARLGNCESVQPERKRRYSKRSLPERMAKRPPATCAPPSGPRARSASSCLPSWYGWKSAKTRCKRNMTSWAICSLSSTS